MGGYQIHQLHISPEFWALLIVRCQGSMLSYDIGKLPKGLVGNRIYLYGNPRLQELQTLTTKYPLAQLKVHFQRLPQVPSYLLETDSYGARDNPGYYICHTASYYQYLKLELRDNTKGFTDIQNETHE